MITRQDRARQLEREFEAFLVHGGVVTVCKTYAPRKTERTFPANKGSVFNMGHQVSGLKMSGSTTLYKRG